MIGVDGQKIKQTDDDDPYGISSSKYKTKQGSAIERNVMNDVEEEDEEPQFVDDDDQGDQDYEEEEPQPVVQQRAQAPVKRPSPVHVKDNDKPTIAKVRSPEGQHHFENDIRRSKP